MWDNIYFYDCNLRKWEVVFHCVAQANGPMKVKRKMRGNFIKKTKIYLLFYFYRKNENPDEVSSLPSLSSKHLMRFLACLDFTVVLIA